MAFPEETITYLNTTIRNINSQLGWGGDASSLSITLVEDESLGQSFIPPTVGTPTYFDYNGWTFGGIFQSWNRSRGADGFTYSVIITDPRDVLDGVQVVLFGYSGITFNLSNLYNVFGYLETAGFGASGASESGGINGRLAVSTLQGLTNTTPIVFRGNYYRLDLTNLYNLMSSDYRIMNEKLNVLELITSIAHDAICDFFIRLEYRGGYNYIVPYFISRANPPVLTAIENFINTSEVTYGTVSNSVGRELVNETTSKMLVGGKVCKMFYNTQNMSEKYLHGIDTSSTIPDNVIIRNLGSIGETVDIKLTYSNNNQKSAFIDWRNRLRTHLQSKAEEANIWPYWGHDARGNLIISYGIGESSYYEIPNSNPVYLDNNIQGNHIMIIDGREIARLMAPYYGGRVDPYLIDYMTDTAELTFALEGFDEWLRYILLTSCNPLHHNCLYQVNDNLNLSLVAQGAISQDSGAISKAEKLCVGYFNFDKLREDLCIAFYGVAINMFNYIVNNNPLPAFARFPMNGDPFGLTNTFVSDLKAIRSNTQIVLPNNPSITLLEVLEDVYEVIRNFAQKHLGKTYMIRTPGIQAKRDSGTGEITYSVQQTSGGFFEEDVWPTAIENNLMPSDTQRLLTGDNRLRSYVRFTNKLITKNNFTYGMLNPSKIGIHNIITNYNELNPNNPYAEYFFVLCNVEDKPVYLDNSTLSDARLVIELPDSMVLRQPRNYKSIYILYKNFLENTKIVFNKTAYNNMSINFNSLDNFDRTSIWRTIRHIFSGILGNDGFLNSTAGSPSVMPDLAVVALESNTERYGPWFVQGLSGKTELEQDNNLVPWHYGGFTELNTVANAMLYQAASNRQEVEKGTVEFPGAPTYLLGDAMVADGPVITNISVQIDPQAGVTTTYNLQTWTKQFGELPKRYADKLSRLNKIVNDNNTYLNKVVRGRNAGESNIEFTGGTGRKLRRPSRKNSIHSSMVVIGAAHNYTTDSSGNIISNSRAAFMPGYYLENQSYDRYEDKAFMSIDGIFRPYCTETNVGESGMPHFEQPLRNSNHTFQKKPNSYLLNPFNGQHDINLVSQNLNLDTTEVDNPFENKALQNLTDFASPSSVKAISFKGPMVVTGWGYTLEGLPVPAHTGNPLNFADNHKVRQDLWKTGPVDLRWDNNAKIWAFPRTNIKFGYLAADIPLGGSGIVNLLYKDTFYTSVGAGGKHVYENTFESIYAHYPRNYFPANAGLEDTFDSRKYECLSRGTKVIIAEVENYIDSESYVPSKEYYIINDDECREANLVNQELTLGIGDGCSNSEEGSVISNRCEWIDGRTRGNPEDIYIGVSGVYLFDIDIVTSSFNIDSANNFYNYGNNRYSLTGGIEILLQKQNKNTLAWSTLDSTNIELEAYAFLTPYTPLIGSGISGYTLNMTGKTFSEAPKIYSKHIINPTTDGRIRLLYTASSGVGHQWSTDIAVRGSITKLRTDEYNIGV